MKQTMFVLENHAHELLSRKGTAYRPKFDNYELSLTRETDNDIERVDTDADLKAPGKLQWSVYGHIPEQGVDWIRDFSFDPEGLEEALSFLHGFGAGSQYERDAIYREWVPEIDHPEEDPVDFETVSGVLRDARDLIVVLREHLAHATATVGDIRKADKMVKDIDALDL